MSSSNLILENLPYDNIFNILCCFESFDDFNALITSSPVCYRIFGEHEHLILKAISKNIVDEDTWEDYTKVLTYQRHINADNTISNYAILKLHLASEFIFWRHDIPQLIVYEWGFKECSNSFTTIIWSSYLCLLGSKRTHPAKHAVMSSNVFTTYPRPIPNMFHTYPSFTTKDTFPMNLFYKLFLLNFRFRYDSITAFAAREPLTDQECANLRLVSQVLRLRCGFEDYIWSCGYELFVKGLFGMWGFSKENPSENPMLFLKIKKHVDSVLLTQSPRLSHEEHWSKGRVLMKACKQSSVGFICEKYGVPEYWV